MAAADEKRFSLWSSWGSHTHPVDPKSSVITAWLPHLRVISDLTLSGIGFATALELAKRNARVILACRNKERAEAARDTIVQATGNKNVVVRELDLSRLTSVREFAERVSAEEERVDFLINNAGVIGKGLQKLLKLKCLK